MAIWDATAADPKKRDPKTRDLSDTTRFSIFVRGLSNGYVQVDGPAPGLPPITQYKTLQLNFQRKGDRFSVDSRDIDFVAAGTVDLSGRGSYNTEREKGQGAEAPKATKIEKK